MKIYSISYGVYDDYHVHMMFRNKRKAEELCKKLNGCANKYIDKKTLDIKCLEHETLMCPCELQRFDNDNDDKYYDKYYVEEFEFIE